MLTMLLFPSLVIFIADKTLDVNVLCYADSTHRVIVYCASVNVSYSWPSRFVCPID